MTSKNSNAGGGFRHWLMLELRAYVILSLYLWICFSALLLYGSSLLQVNHVPLLPLGSAAIKALILAKVILIGRAAKIVDTVRNEVLLHRILLKSLATLALLLLFIGAEELATGLVHGHSLADSIAALADRPWLQWVAPSMVMLLVLIPMIAFEEIDIALGRGTLMRIMLARSHANQAQS